MNRSQGACRWYFVGVAVLLLLVNGAAFLPSLLNPSTRNTPLPLTLLVGVHAAVSVAWLLVFLAQVTLVATGRTALHRRLGIIGAGLVVAFTATGIATVIEETRRGFDLSGDLSRLPIQEGADARSSLLGAMFFFVMFATLAGAALWFRRRPALHKRLMGLAVLGGMTPTPVAHVVGHWSVLHPVTPLIFLSSLAIALSLLAVHDRISEGRFHQVTLWGGLAVFLSTLLFNVIVVPSVLWRDFAEWVTR